MLRPGSLMSAGDKATPLGALLMNTTGSNRHGGALIRCIYWLADSVVFNNSVK
jgi:hypothetical protein